MHIRRLLLAGVVFATVAAPMISGAHFLKEACNGVVTVVEVPGAATAYVEDRSDPDEPDDINHWVYIESNGHPGLQTGGNNDVHGLESTPAGDFADPCFSEHGVGNGQDTLVM